MLIYLHFLCIFKLLVADAATLEYVPISPNLPLYDDSLHTQRTRKWPPSPSSPPVHTGSRSDERAATRARRSSAATTPIVGPAKRRPGSIRGLAPTSTSVSRLQTFGDLIDLHITDMCEVGKPPRREPRPPRSRRSSAISGVSNRNAVGKEKIGHLDRQKLIDYGKMRAEQGAGPVTLNIYIGAITRVITLAAAGQCMDIFAGCCDHAASKTFFCTAGIIRCDDTQFFPT